MLPGESFWREANLDAMREECARRNKLRDEAYARLKQAEEQAKDIHYLAELTEQRFNYWKQVRKL